MQINKQTIFLILKVNCVFTFTCQSASACPTFWPETQGPLLLHSHPITLKKMNNNKSSANQFFFVCFLPLNHNRNAWNWYLRKKNPTYRSWLGHGENIDNPHGVVINEFSQHQTHNFHWYTSTSVLQHLVKSKNTMALKKQNKSVKSAYVATPATLSRAREEMYTCSAVSTAGASVGGPCKAKHTFANANTTQWGHHIFPFCMFTCTRSSSCVFGARCIDRLSWKNLTMKVYVQLNYCTRLLMCYRSRENKSPVEWTYFWHTPWFCWIYGSCWSSLLTCVSVDLTCPSPGIPPPSLSSRSILGSVYTQQTHISLTFYGKLFSLVKLIK